MKDAAGLFNRCTDNEFSRSIKITDEKEIDERLLAAYIRESVAVNKKGFKRVVTEKTVPVPEALRNALAQDKKALHFFEGLSYGYRKDLWNWSPPRNRKKQGRQESKKWFPIALREES